MSLLSDAFANLLAFFYDIWPTYGGAIILLTLAVMVVVTPLTLKGTRSMMMMQRLQPEIKRIQTKYKDDRPKQNEELMAFYKENNINPLGGCLPLLVQMPVFIVLYTVLRGLTRRVPETGLFNGWGTGMLDVGGVGRIPIIDALPFDPAFISQNSSLYQAMSATTEMDWLGMNLAESASTAMGVSPVSAIPYLILILLVGVTGVVQQRQIQGRNTGAAINPQQQMIMKFMPLFLPVISFTLPAGLVVYFAVSNLYRVGQQWFISRTIYGIKKGEKGGVVDTKEVGSGKDAKAAKSSRSDKKAVAASSSKGGGKSTGRSQSPKGSPVRSGRGKATPSNKPAGSPAQPALQPRARKKKK